MIRPQSVLHRFVPAVVVLLALCGPGCAAPRGIESTRPTHVVILPGIGGADPFLDRLRVQIESAHSGVSAQVWDWTQLEWRPSLLNLANLEDYDRNLRRVDVLKRRVLEWRAAHPTDRLWLLGFSGGTAIAVFAAERLPEPVELEGLVLLSSGLSPGYDLRPALRRARRGVFNYYSSEDRAVLSDLTRKRGTMDRRFSVSAGLVGFEPPTDAALSLKLRQLAWAPTMHKTLGNSGDHMGALGSTFVRAMILPLFNPDPAACPEAWQPTTQPANPNRPGNPSKARTSKPVSAADDAETGRPRRS